MTKQELDQWYELMATIETGEKLNYYDYMELIRLNHLVMEVSHKIHNDNMLRDRNNQKERGSI